jgi:anti-anti-sigma regulatory factor
MKQKTFNCKINQGDNPGSLTLILEGDLGLRNSSAIGTFLNSTAFDCEKVTVHLKNVEKLDITTLQYIKALQQQLQASRVKTEIISDLPDELKRLLGNTGFSSLL